MIASPHERFLAEKHALADLYIDCDFDRQIMGKKFDHNASPAFYEYCCNYVSQVCGTYSFINWHDNNVALNAAITQRNRAEDWHQNRLAMRHRAQRNLATKLTPRFTHRQWATPTKKVYLYNARQTCAPIVAEAVKLYNPRGTTDRSTLADFLFHNNIKARLSYEALVRINPMIDEILTAIARQENNLARGDWQKVCWAKESWFRNSTHYERHFLHVSTTNPQHVAYTQNGDKLVRDIQTAVKPGRYLMQFFGPESDNPVLTEVECRDWANRHIEQTRDPELKFVANDDPDGWEWVYEHASGFTSCMQYRNHPGRHLDSGLYGKNHPVRLYANKHNNLALAYIGDDHKTAGDDGRVYARAIVNTKTKEYVRLYGDDRIKSALQRAGYSHDSGCLGGQVLTRKEMCGGWIMPYLDGHYTRVESDYVLGEEVWRISNDGYDAQNSSGLMDADEETFECPCCGERFDDEDDLTYVEIRGESICQSCLEDRYAYAYGRWYQDYFDRDDCIICESDDEWYVEEYASNHDVYQCAVSDNWYSIDDLVSITAGEYDGEYIHHEYAKELPNGEWCLEDEYDDLCEQLEAEDEADDEDEVETEATTMTQPQPTGDERFAVAA